MPANNKPVIDAKAAAKARRKRRNANRLKHWQGEVLNVDLKKVSLAKQALQSIAGFFGPGQQGGTYVFIHVSKAPGARYGRTYYNPVKRARQQERAHEKRRKKLLRQKQRMGDAPLLPNTVFVLPQAA